MHQLSRRLFLTALTPLVGLACCGALSAAENRASGKRVALSGYDPVSYFTDGRPEKGSGEFTFAFDDAMYWFKNSEHRAMFARDPERYAPQYDGYCAISVSSGAGARTESDPEAWAIAEGKLYVFSGKGGPAKFAQHSDGIVSKANANWQALRKAP